MDKYNITVVFEPVEIVRNLIHDGTIDKPVGWTTFSTYEEAEQSITEGWHGDGEFAIRKVYKVTRQLED